MNGRPFSIFFADRAKTRELPGGEPSANPVVEIPIQAAALDGNRGWRITLNRDNGFLPTRIDQYSREVERLQTRVEITELLRLPAGISVPVKATITSYDASPTSPTFGKPTQVAHYEVDVAKSKWNFEADPTLFSPAFPIGTTVRDEVSGKTFVVGGVQPIGK